MLQDVIELRKKNWIPRRILRENGPKTIQQVHHDAAREMGVYIQPSTSPTNMSFFPGGGDLFGRPMNGYTGPSRGPITDMFGPLPSSPPVMGGIGTGPGVIPMDPFNSGGYMDNRRGRGFPAQFGNRRGGTPEKYSPRVESKPSYAKSDRERHHDDDDDDVTSGGHNTGNGEIRGGRGGGGGNGGGGALYGNRGFHNGRGRDVGFVPRGGFNNNNFRGQQQYNRNPNYPARGGYNQDVTPGRDPVVDRSDRSFPPPERNMDRDPQSFNRDQQYNRGGGGGGSSGGFNRDDGFSSDGYNRGGYRGRGGFESRGGYNQRGGFDNNRGGYDQPRSGGGFENFSRGYDQGRGGGFDHPRGGGYSHGRGGFDQNRSSFDNDFNNPQKDLEKLPPRFRKQMEMQNSPPNGSSMPSSGRDSFGHSSETRVIPPREKSGSTSSGSTSSSTYMSGECAAPVQQERQRESFFGPPPPQMKLPPKVRTPSPPPVSVTPPPSHTPPPSSGFHVSRSPSKPEEISLRPVRMPAFRPNIPSMLPKSAQGPPTASQMYKPINAGPQSTFEDMIPPAQKASILGVGPQVSKSVKPVQSQEKAKELTQTNKLPTQDELKQKTDNMLNEFLDKYDTDAAKNTLRTLKAPTSYMPELLTHLILRSLDKSDTDREAVAKLIIAMKQESFIDSQLFMQGFEVVLNQMKSLESDVPLVKSYVSKLAAHVFSGDVISLCELSCPLQQGRHYPLFLLCLQQIHKLNDKEWLVKVFNESKIDLQHMLPECDQSKERMLEILDDRGLNFMFPLLRVQSDLTKQMQSDTSSANLYKWIKESYSPSVLADAGFIHILYPTILTAITNETTLAATECYQDVEEEASKAAVKREKELLQRHKVVLTGFIHDNVQLQVQAIYAVQVFCHKNNFPKGMLLRMFMSFYDHEIIDEDAFLRWKEDLNDEFPGKGKALFQVNQWLNWLEHAESESSDDE